MKISQVLPRIGVHYQYLNSDVLDGHLFTNWSKAFKAPTLDQLYDTREINFFGQEFNYSNTGLVPQTSTNLDIGLNQEIFPSNSIYSGELSLAIYIMSISNEIDFDMATFKYGNILKSQHKGIECFLGIYKSNRIRLNSTIDIAEVTFGSGDYEGNMLKNIPKITYTNRFSIKTSAFSNLVLTQKFFGSVYLDDANTVSLPSNTILNCKLQFIIKDLSIDLSLFNLTDKFYYSSGYLLFDPMLQENVQFYFPAQRRYFHFNFNYKLSSFNK
jgi:outer membrane receptor protein involved in Fe transport